jgi:hypothetical protein
MPDGHTVMEDCLVRCVPAKSNPLRPPDWRHRRARDLLAGHRPASLRSDDLWIRRVLALLTSRRRDAGPRAQATCNLRDPAVATAIELHAGGDALRTVVEAWLLAAVPPPEIAERTGLPATGIEAYHACFWDVADRLSRPDYIVNGIILAGVSTSAAARRHDTALKLAAYLGGPRALAGLLATPHPQTEQLIDLFPRLEEINDGLIALNKHLALYEQPAMSAELSREAFMHRLRRQAARQQDENLTLYEQNVQAVLDSVQFRMRRREDAEKCSSELRPYFHGAVEMRADELMEYNRTGVLPPIEEFMVEFPQPPAREADAAEGGPGDA